MIAGKDVIRIAIAVRAMCLLRLQFRMRHARFILIVPIILWLAACGPVEPEPLDRGETFSQESVGQWQPDLHDPRVVADRTVLAEINRDLSGMPGTGALLAAYAFGDAAESDDFLYVDPVRGFTLEVPYNENWSTATYVLPPYERYDEVSEIRFGPLLRHAVRGYQRAYILRFASPRSAEAAERAYEAQQGMDSASVYVSAMGSGFAVMVADMRGDCPAPLIEIPGENYNYVFTVSCEAVSRWPDALERLNAVVGTLRLQSASMP